MDTETSSSEEQSSTECSTDSSDEDEKLETAQICGVRIQLPQGLCERKDVFNEFFSASTWNLLSEEHKQHLNSFLPTFPENDEHEKAVTLTKLFNKERFRFTSPLNEFHEHLKAGHYRPDIAKMRLLIKKAERKEAKYRHKLYRERLKEDILESRHKLVNLVRTLPPGVEPKMEKLVSSTPPHVNPISYRAKRRYFQELASVREKVDETGFSSDENYPEGPPTPLSRKQKRHLNAIKNSALNNNRIVSTLIAKPHVLDLERLITPNCNPFFISEDSYKNLLLVHKRKRLEDIDSPEYNTESVTITDVINRTDLTSFKKLSVGVNVNTVKHHIDFKPSSHKKKIKRESIPSTPPSPELLNKSNPFFGHSSDSDSESFYDTKLFKCKKPIIIPVKEIKVEPVDECKPIDECTSGLSKVTPATLSDLEGIDMMNLPIDLDDSIDILEFNNKPELMQDTHANFLSLVRDIICSTNEHRMSMKILEDRLKSWQENPISPLNDWYSLTDNWVTLLPMAINFLSGNFSEQPDDFVPYMEFKEKLDMYQWIGAGRDSDSLLNPLCQYWFEHRNEMKPALLVTLKEDDVEVSDRSQTPPPPRCPTTWSIRKANCEEIKAFQEQEQRRYSNPHKAFTYRCNGYESVVGPVKGIYNNQNIGSTKARGHSVLNADRPNFVTILTLVRDATARLPNGEGTRADICELLKSSQYLSLNVADNVLQSVVSGALDRMHTQFDPCVKYESKRKVWIYLHRNRSEEDFERIHHQYQGVNKNMKKSGSKSKPVKTKIKQNKSNVNQMEHQSNPSTSKSALSSKDKAINNPQRKTAFNQSLQKSPTKNLQVQQDLISENTIKQTASSSTTTKHLPPGKSLVKIISSSQGKSLILPTNQQLLKQLDSKKQQPVVTQQLLQTIAQQKLLLQKQNTGTTDMKLQNRPNIKNATLLKSCNSSTVTLESSHANIKDSIVVCNAPSLPVHEQVIQSGVQNKISQPRLTPAQQQQILQSLKQKVLPLQQTVTSSQYRAVAKIQKPTPILTHNKVIADGSSSKPIITTAAAQTPIVAKVLTNAAGQVISVESLLAHQKQHGSLPQGTTLRISGTKGGQPNLIQLATSNPQTPVAQFAVATSNITSLANQPKLIISTPVTTVATSTVTVSKPLTKTNTKTQIPSKFIPKIAQQLVSAKFVTQNVSGQKIVQPKMLVAPSQNSLKVPISNKGIAISKTVGINVTANPNTIRMANINLAQIGGKPVLITSKGSTFQNLQGQNIIIQTQANNSANANVIISNADKTISTIAQQSSSGTSNVANQQNAQVILSPPLKVQQTSQVVLSNAIKPTAVSLTQQNPGGSTNQIVFGGQTMRLQTSGTNTHRVVLASQNQGQIITQQILLPVGFQGTPLNIKALQGLKVVPIAQSQAGRGVQGRQVFARVMNPANFVRVTQTTDTTDVSNSTKTTAE
ncbi:hypothetical protein FQA39_LY02118 [Lamprigera yunnana]|nr:hypothetical protein FQA39_LY02118 [Lamprigera yunnana]